MAHGYPDFQGDKSGLYAVAEWAAKEGTDKNFSAYASGVAQGFVISAPYTVPPLTTLYLTQLSFGVFASDAVNMSKNQYAYAYIYDVTHDEELASLGGNGGGVLTQPKPLVVKADTHIHCELQNMNSHASELYLKVSGYEV